MKSNNRTWEPEDLACEDARDADVHSWALTDGLRAIVPCFCPHECGPSISVVSLVDGCGTETTCEGCGEEVSIYTYPRTRERLLQDVAAALFADDDERAIAVCEEAAGNEKPCPLGPRRCPNCRASALDAGIPESVIDGETTLRDHFSEAEIARNCGDTARADELDRAESEDLRDAQALVAAVLR